MRTPSMVSRHRGLDCLAINVDYECGLARIVEALPYTNTKKRRVVLHEPVRNLLLKRLGRR